MKFGLKGALRRSACAGRKCLKTFSCEEESDGARAREKYAVAGWGFYGNSGGGGGWFSNRIGLKMLQQQGPVGGIFLTKVPISRFPSLCSVVVNLS